MEENRSRYIYDKEVFLANFEGMEEILSDVLQSFEEGLPNLLEAVQSAIGEGDAAKLQLSAHTLKGVLSNFYAEPSRGLAFELEKMGKNKELDSASALFQKMTEQIEVLSVELKKLAIERGLL